MLCRLSFGFCRMCKFVPDCSSLGGNVVLLALNFIISGIIGGFILVRQLIVAIWYILLTVYRLITGLFPHYGNVENCRSRCWKRDSLAYGNGEPSHRPANIFPTALLFWQFTHIPTTPTAATYTYPILFKREYEKNGRTANRTNRKAVRPFLCVAESV